MAHVKGVVGKITGQTKAWKKHDKRSAEAAHEMAKRGKKQKSFFSDTGKSHGKGHRILDTERNRKRWQKAYGEWPKKAKGGRIGLKHGSAQSHYTQHGYGPHKIQLRSGKPKLAKKGW